MKHAAAMLAVGLVAAAGSSKAQVTGVITHTSAVVQFRPGADPVTEPGTTTYSGQQLSSTLGSEAFGSGGSFSSTSKLETDHIEFQNGNAASGTESSVVSRTVVDITFRNDGVSTVAPVLQSTITAAGLGLYTGPACLENVTTCGPGLSYPGDFRNFQDFGGAGDIAGASFLFRITGAGETLYELTGQVALQFDPALNKVVPLSDFGLASTELKNFRMTSPAGSEHEFGFAWDATDILVNFPTGTLLAPGESSTLTYETEVRSFSFAPCFGLLTNACLTAYSSFGDPIGRGGGVRPSLAPMALTAAAPAGVSFDSFRFATPTFHDGVLSYQLIASGAVPETDTWILLIMGFGAIGSAIRRNSRVRTAPLG